MAESNEMIVSATQVKDLYPECVDVFICRRVIKTYEVISRQLYRLREAWKNFT